MLFLYWHNKLKPAERVNIGLAQMRKKAYRKKIEKKYSLVSCCKSLFACLSHPFWHKLKKKKTFNIFFTLRLFSPIPSHLRPISQDFQLQKAYSNAAEKAAAMTDKINVKKLTGVLKKSHWSFYFFFYSFHRDIYLIFSSWRLED